MTYSKLLNSSRTDRQQLSTFWRETEASVMRHTRGSLSQELPLPDFVAPFVPKLGQQQLILSGSVGFEYLGTPEVTTISMTPQPTPDKDFSVREERVTRNLPACNIQRGRRRGPTWVTHEWSLHPANTITQCIILGIITNRQHEFHFCKIGFSKEVIVLTSPLKSPAAPFSLMTVATIVCIACFVPHCCRVFTRSSCDNKGHKLKDGTMTMLKKNA